MSAVLERKHLAPVFPLVALAAPLPASEQSTVHTTGAAPVAHGDALADAGSTHATIRTAVHGSMVRSRMNVRKKATDVTELAALIRTQGLLHNLVGYLQTVGGCATGVVEVVAGGRRLEAIGQLIAGGVLPVDYRIPYLLVTEDEAIEISMAENRGRENMHPADVYEAMLELTARDRSVEDIAISFNLDNLTVKRCLKLARISPRLLELYRNDEANFEHMMALAISDSHAAQEQAWDSLGKHSRYAHELRRILTAQQVDVQSDRLARYVGVEAFEKAGGAVIRDLFSDSGAGYIRDVPLLERLAMVKLEKQRCKLAKEGYAWIEVTLRADFGELAQFGRVRMDTGEPTAKQKARLAAMDEQQDRLHAQIDALGDDGGVECETLYDLIDAMAQERREIHESRPDVPNADDKAIAGAVVTLDHCGEVLIMRDLIRPGDRAGAGGRVDGPAVAAPRARSVHSDRLTHVLTSHRTVALQAELMDRPDIALVVLTHALLSTILKPGGSAGRIAKLTLGQPSLADEVKKAPADTAFAARRQHIVDLLPSGKDGDGYLAWLHRQPQPVVLELMAFCIACSLDATQTRDGPCPAYAELAALLNMDMGRWWKATAADYFNHVSRERTMAVVAQAVSAEAAVPLEKMKKGAAALAAERALAATSWLPEPLRAD
jgi:ParB family chromosome partitioning protein